MATLGVGPGIRTVHLHGKVAAGRVALVDEGDYEMVGEYRWTVHDRIRPGGRRSGPYAVTKFGPASKRGILQMHNLIMGSTGIDHRNHDGLDNRRENLRPADGQQNAANARKSAGCSSQYKGVSWWRPGGSWAAYITVNGNRIHLGYFALEADAARVRDIAAIAAWGEYATLNLIGGPQ